MDENKMKLYGKNVSGFKLIDLKCAGEYGVAREAERCIVESCCCCCWMYVYDNETCHEWINCDKLTKYVGTFK